ncbi:MAG: ribonuclease P protein component [Treponema sp.]|jgi:ribonuclease P protein component|nr:ribonuclease P protein component [Treponema sp.]
MERLKKYTDIHLLFSRGNKVQCFGAKLLFRTNKREYNRITVSFSRKFGNAVARNRARRLGREAYRFLRNRLSTGFDMIIVLYPSNDTLKARLEQLNSLFKKAGLYV